MFIAVFAAVLILSLWAGWLAYRASERRWVQVVVTVLTLWLPLWDALPGLYYLNKAAREVGGLKISRTVHAEGYLDSSCSLCRDAYIALQGSKFRYVEVRIGDRSFGTDPLTTEPGYYEYRIFPPTSTQCERKDLAADQARYFPAGKFGLKDLCVISTRRDTPVSRYRLDSSNGWQRSERYSWLRAVDLNWQRVVDNDTDEVLAQACSVRYTPWLFPFSLEPWSWIYTDHPPANGNEFDLSQIIEPPQHEN
jgi:hypothetical protein